MDTNVKIGFLQIKKIKASADYWEAECKRQTIIIQKYSLGDQIRVEDDSDVSPSRVSRTPAENVATPPSPTTPPSAQRPRTEDEVFDTPAVASQDGADIEVNGPLLSPRLEGKLGNQ